MIQKVRNYISKYDMLQPGDTVAAGVSGGADSVCLLFLLNIMREEIPFRLMAVHVNHGIREEAIEDEAYVQKLCGQWQIPFFAVHENVASLAKKQGLSEEEAGRNLRYASFERILREEAQGSRGKIAVAHNKNDRAETMLFNLVRGTGLTGLCSIPPVRNDIIRPLLCVARKEIEEFLEKKQISYCIDRTNGEDTYTRNKLRNHLFPYLTQNISPAAVDRMNHTADLLSEAKAYITQETVKAYEKCRLPESSGAVGIKISVERFLQEPEFIQGQILLTAVEELLPGRKDITSGHIAAMKNLFYAHGSKSADLPYGFRAVKEYDVFMLFPKKQEKTETSSGEEIHVMKIPGSYVLQGAGELSFSILENEKCQDIPEKTYTKWFDYDKIIKSLVIRKRQSGDYLTIDGKESKKSLKNYMIQEKIPRSRRGDIWILADGSHILWVIGYRISSRYKINKNTKRILQVQLRGGIPWQNT